jgi:hypothetical protein
MATAAFLLGACSDSSQPSGSTAPARVSTATASTPTTSTTVATTIAPTTSVPPPSTTLAGGGWAEVPVITSPWGALGWWDGSGWVDAVDQPDTDLTGRYRLVGLLGSGRADAATVGETCHEGAGGVRPYPEIPWGEGDPFPVWSLALSAPWELGSVEVFEAGADYGSAVSQFFAIRDFEVEDPTIVQAIRADLFADGTPDAIIVAESIGDPVSLLPSVGDYSVVMVFADDDPEQAPLLLGSEVLVRDLDSGAIPYTLRVPAVADLNGDGTLEVAVASAYYEGRGVNVFAQVEGIRGLDSVLVAGCGV